MNVWRTVLLLTAFCNSVKDSRLIGDPSLLVLHKFPVKGEEKDIVAEIQDDYKQWGMPLLKDSNGLKIKAIEMAKLGNPVDITDEILQQWLKGKGLAVTWETLIKCLQDAKLKVAAGYIESALSQERPPMGQQSQPLSRKVLTGIVIGGILMVLALVTGIIKKKHEKEVQALKCLQEEGKEKHEKELLSEEEEREKQHWVQQKTKEQHENELQELEEKVKEQCQKEVQEEMKGKHVKEVQALEDEMRKQQEKGLQELKRRLQEEQWVQQKMKEQHEEELQELEKRLQEEQKTKEQHEKELQELEWVQQKMKEQREKELQTLEEKEPQALQVKKNRGRFSFWKGSRRTEKMLSPLHTAAREGHDDNKDDSSRTPLHIAAQQGDMNKVTSLVNSGASVHIKDKQGMTPPHLAAHRGRYNLMGYLVGKGAKVNAKDLNRRTPLHAAASEGHEYTVKSLVENGADINIKNKAGRTPLHLAAEGGHKQTVKFLVSKNANINTQDVDGMTPLHMAANQGRPGTVKYLVEQKANEHPNQRTDINIKNNDGLTPLHMAAREGYVNTVKLLVESQADISITYNNGRTLLHMAAEGGHENILTYLASKESGLGVDMDIKDENGMTPLHVAAKRGRLESVRYVVNNGATVDIEDNDNRTPLHIAAGEDSVNTVKFLVNKGADVNKQDNDGCTPLHIAAEGGHMDIVYYLVAQGADINITDKDGMTPLDVARKRGHVQIEEFLRGAGMSHGPKVDTRPTSPTGPMICPQGSAEQIDKGFHGIHALEGSPEIGGWTRFVIIGSEPQVFHWKGFGFKLHVPRNALDASVSNCIIFVKAFIPNKIIELPENSQLISAIYHISMPLPNMLRKAVDIEIEHCCKLNEGKPRTIRFVTSTSALVETASFSYIDGGHFPNDSTYGRITLSHFSLFAIVWQGIMSLFSVRYCIKVYQESVSLTMKYIHFILIKNLQVDLQDIDKRYERHNELYGCEATFDTDRDCRVKLDIDQDGETTEEGWRIRPCVDPPEITMESAAYFIPGQQPPECKLVAQTSSQVSQFEYRLKLKGLQMPLSILLCIPIQTTTSTQGASTLTLREIQNELNEMEAARWYQLGIQLGVPIAILSTIESDHPHDTQRRMTEVINWWFRNTPERSWAELAEAVEMMGGYAVLAERLRQRMSQVTA